MNRAVSIFIPRSSYRQFTVNRSRKFALGRTDLQIRSFSVYSVPRFVFHAMRIPAAGFTIGVGGLTYANYKFNGKSDIIYFVKYVYVKIYFIDHNDLL